MKPKIRFKGFEGEWKNLSLDDCVNFLDSKRKPIEEGNRTKGIFPYYGASGIVDYINDYIFDEELILLSEDGANITDRNYPVCFLAKGKYWVNNHAHVLKAKEGFINSFLCNAMERKDYTLYNTGMAMPKLNKEACKRIPVLHPSSNEQKAIASYFTTLDSQISASTSRLASLKQMKAASLQAMFPQEGETVPKIRFKGFEGEWTWLKLGDISEQVKRKAPINSTAPVMMISALNGFINQSEKYSDNNAGSSLANYTLLKKGELSYNHGYSKTRNFGSCFNLLVEEARIPFVYHSFRLTNDNDSFYAYYLNSGTKDKDLKRLVSSTARMDGLLNISFKNYMELSVPHPSLAEQQAIANYFTSLDRQISLQSQRLEKLKQIKSACLDKMFV